MNTQTLGALAAELEAMHDMRFRVHARLLLVEAGCELMSLADSRLTPIANLLEGRERFFLRVHELEGRAKRSPEDVGFTTD